MKLSLIWVFIAGLVGLTFITVTSIIVSSSVTSRAVLLEHANDIMENTTAFTMNKSHNHLLPAQDAATLTSRLSLSNIVSSDNVDSMESSFYDQLSINSQFSGIYYGNSRGEFIMASRSTDKDSSGFLTKSIRMHRGQRTVQMIRKSLGLVELNRREIADDTYDPRTRPWYIDALSTKAMIRSLHLFNQ